MNTFNGSRCALFLAISAALYGITAHADDDTDGRQASLGKVTVVGEKSERSLQDTTSSVSVIDGSKLHNNQYLSVNRAVSEITNVVVLPGTVPDIRGVSGNGSATGFNSFSGGSKARVARLVDGVAEPFVADLTGDTGLWDIEQIEVYRGPQSTTNGRNSMAGSIYIKTYDPTFSNEGKVRLSARNQDRMYNVATMGNANIIDNELAFRIAGEKTEGDTYNEGRRYDSHAPDHDMTELESQRIRSKLLWQPAKVEGLSAILSYVTAEEKGDVGREYFTVDDPWDFIPVTQRYMDTKSDTASLKVDYALNETVSFDVLVDYTDFEWGFDGYEENEASETQVSMDETDTNIDAKVNIHQPGSALTAFVGLAYSDRSQDFESLGGYPYFGDDSSKSTALYGEARYDITSQMSITAGARIQKEEQTRNFTYLANPEAELHTDKTVKLPKLALQYAVSADTTLFVSGRRGYNGAGGAFNSTENSYYYFDEEFVTTYEAGARSTLMDGDLNLSINLFHNTYTGFQAVNASRAIENIDEAFTRGTEVEARLFVNSSLQLRGGLGLLETGITDSADEYPEADGNRLNSAPGVTANAGASYWITPDWNVDLSANYVAEYYGDFLNTRTSKAGDYLLTNLSTSYEQGSWLLSAFINNLADEEALLYQSPANARQPDGLAQIADPRTIGASVIYSF